MVDILDHKGEPIRRQDLREPQTAKLTALHHEIGDHPSNGLTVQKLAAILREAEQGDIKSQCELFEDMEEKDGHILAEMGKRKRAILGLEWDIVPPRNATAQEERAAELAREIIQDIPDLEDLLLDLLDAIGKAYSAAELTWQRDGREWYPAAAEHRPPTWFTIPRADRNSIRLRNNTPEGEALQPFGWVLHTHKAKSGYLPRGGLHRTLAWPYLFKNYSLRDLAEFLEIYGLPLRLGTYPPGATDKEKSTLLRAVMSIGHAAAGIIPEGMQIDFKDAAKGGKDPFEAMIAWAEKTQSKAILGGTLTSQADGASSTNALGNVHNEVRWDLAVSDARQLAGTLTRDLVYPIVALNIGGIDSLRRSPRFVFDTREPEDLSLYAESLPKLVGIGMRIPSKWAHDKLNIPEPDEDEEILERQQQAPLAPLRRQSRAALRLDVDGPDVADDYTEQLDEAAAVIMTGMIEPVRRLVMEAESLEALRDGIIDLFEQGQVDDLAGVLQRAFAAADLAGRFEVDQDE